MKTLRLISICIIVLTSLASAMVPCHAAQESREIVDMAGRHVRVPLKISRIVTAGGTPAVNAFVAGLGRADLIVNGLPPQMKSGRWKLQRIFIPAFDGPVVSGMGPAWTPDLEALRALPHELLLVDNEQTARMLERRGFTVVCLLWKGPDSVPETMRLLGNLLDCREQAEAYVGYYATTLKRVQDATGSMPVAKRPRAIFCRLEPLSLPMVSTARILIERSGGVYASKGTLPADHATISLETLLTWNPDVLFVWGADDVKTAFSDPRFSSLKAVKNRRVFVIPMGLHPWSNYTPEQAVGILWMSKLLYPAVFEKISMEQETREFYRRFYGRQLTSRQLGEVLSGHQ